jgi:alpha-beta hydrolase superfamily lysophospholipase
MRRGSRMRRTVRWTKRVGLLAVAALATFLVVRAVDSQRGPPLELWHTFVPDDLRAPEIDRMDWRGYLAAEARLFESVRTEVTERLDAEDRTPDNRYFSQSPVHPDGFAQDWNRSSILEPQGPPVGAVVLLHGLTDTPYSLRHVARHYRELGFVAVGIRLPAHGTVPAALTDVEWEDWSAATRLAVREARRLAGGSAPLHIIGFSNGGALALKYAFDAIEDQRLARPDRLVLVSPMVGITAFARFAGLAAWPAVLPAFAKAAWLSLVPEFNPVKYNSFPVNGARQAHRLTVVLQRQTLRLARDGRLAGLAPVLTFQSVVDFTVSTRAVVDGLYAHLPANGSELVLFDRNTSTKLGPLLRPTLATAFERLLPPPPHRFRLTIIANAEPGDAEMVERVIEAGDTTERVRTLGLTYPQGVFSLSHVALPFPPGDALYGIDPDPAEDFGVNLGLVAPRGEIGALIVTLDFLSRLSWNPFFPYMLARIEEGLAAPAPTAGASGGGR